jgi:hypothetical protein
MTTGRSEGGTLAREESVENVFSYIAFPSPEVRLW